MEFRVFGAVVGEISDGRSCCNIGMIGIVIDETDEVIFKFESGIGD